MKLLYHVFAIIVLSSANAVSAFNVQPLFRPCTVLFERPPGNQFQTADKDDWYPQKNSKAFSNQPDRPRHESLNNNFYDENKIPIRDTLKEPRRRIRKSAQVEVSISRDISRKDNSLRPQVNLESNYVARKGSNIPSEGNTELKGDMIKPYSNAEVQVGVQSEVKRAGLKAPEIPNTELKGDMIKPYSNAEVQVGVQSEVKRAGLKAPEIPNTELKGDMIKPYSNAEVQVGVQSEVKRAGLKAPEIPNTELKGDMIKPYSNAEVKIGLDTSIKRRYEEPAQVGVRVVPEVKPRRNHAEVNVELSGGICGESYINREQPVGNTPNEVDLPYWAALYGSNDSPTKGLELNTQKHIPAPNTYGYPPHPSPTTDLLSAAQALSESDYVTHDIEKQFDSRKNDNHTPQFSPLANAFNLEPVSDSSGLFSDTKREMHENTPSISGSEKTSPQNSASVSSAETPFSSVSVPSRPAPVSPVESGGATVGIGSKVAFNTSSLYGSPTPSTSSPFSSSATGGARVGLNDKSFFPASHNSKSSNIFPVSSDSNSQFPSSKSKQESAASNYLSSVIKSASKPVMPTVSGGATVELGKKASFPEINQQEVVKSGFPIQSSPFQPSRLDKWNKTPDKEKSLGVQHSAKNSGSTSINAAAASAIYNTIPSSNVISSSKKSIENDSNQISTLTPNESDKVSPSQQKGPEYLSSYASPTVPASVSLPDKLKSPLSSNLGFSDLKEIPGSTVTPGISPRSALSSTNSGAEISYLNGMASPTSSASNLGKSPRSSPSPKGLGMGSSYLSSMTFSTSKSEKSTRSAPASLSSGFGSSYLDAMSNSAPPTSLSTPGKGSTSTPPRAGSSGIGISSLNAISDVASQPKNPNQQAPQPIQSSLNKDANEAWLKSPAKINSNVINSGVSKTGITSRSSTPIPSPKNENTGKISCYEKIFFRIFLHRRIYQIS